MNNITVDQYTYVNTLPIIYNLCVCILRFREKILNVEDFILASGWLYGWVCIDITI